MLEEVGGHARYIYMNNYANYNQILALADIHKTTFTIIWATFVWVIMPFRFCNALATFQRLIMLFTILLFKLMTVFVDDFSTQSNTSQHLESMKEASMRCKKAQFP